MPERRRARLHFPRGPFASEASDRAPNSLFLEILDWMLAPLLLLWPVSIAVTNHIAHEIADTPYDGALTDAARVLGYYIESLENPVVRLPAAIQTTLAGDATDIRYYRVSAVPPPSAYAVETPPAEFALDGGVVNPGAGMALTIPPTRFDMLSAAIPLVSSHGPRPSVDVRLRDDTVHGEAVRVAYRTIVAQTGEVLLVQVAETRNKREAVVSRIIRGVLLPQFAMIPAAVVLSFLGLSRGLRPLHRLRRRILSRRPGDLSPLALERAPDEIRPVLQALNDMMARLEANLHAQQRFVADAAHQLRTPLTGLKTQAELAAVETDDARLRRSVRLIAQSADRAAHLANQLLVLARTEASHEKVHRVEAVDLRALARAVTIEWAERALAKDIDLSFECGEWPHMSEGVPLLLREMLSNLVDNAIKYTPRGGRVTVRVRLTDFVEVEVEDSGVGIPPDEREKVFERFYRVLGNDESGSGLGLPIVLEIAEMHRARVDLRDGSAGGSLFRVSLVRRGGQASPVDLRPD